MILVYDGEYIDRPVPEPKNRPRFKAKLACGKTTIVDPYWSEDPLYGGWKLPPYAFCKKHNTTERVGSK